MNLQQLEALCSVVRNRFSISGAAESLRRSQPGLSRQIKELEEELGVRIFSRTRNKVISLTPQGEEVLRIGQRIVRDIRNLQQVASENATDDAGELRIATTHVHARYTLPKVMKAFSVRNPKSLLTLRQGDPAQCWELVARGEADIGISTAAGLRQAEDAVAIPIYKLSRCVIVPRDHPLMREKMVTIKRLAEYPLIAYSPSFSGRSIVDEAFARAGLRPKVVCTAIDADVSKTYVELGMGIAILARIAFDPARDGKLIALEADHLFRPGILYLILRKHSYLSRRAYSFVSMYAPHITADLIRRAMDGGDIDRVRLSQKAPVAGFK
jgi:LysR family transcriptional regulator, cys regulon transcriptional activator